MATKTVILLDHREGLLAKTDQTVAIDDLSADKSKWTVIMEAAVEYTRILLDVCAALHPVMVIAADQSLTFLNKWQSQQGMCHIVETLARLGPPKVTEETQPDLSTALQQCVDMGLSNSLLDIQKLLLGIEPARHARVICFTSIDNPANCVDIVNDYLDSNSNEGKIELVVFNLVENKESTESCDPHHVIHNVKPGNLFQLVLDTVIKYHNLTITTITSIPMKEEQSTNTQAAAYNVDIVHPIVELPSCPRERLTMKWSSPKNAQNINLKNCVATYPVTPLDVAERPTICLVNFLLVGKQVVLEYPKPNLSVVLINHGGTIVMHYIANSQRSVFDELTPIVDTPGGKVTDYRGEELQLSIKNLELCPHPPPDAIECELPLNRCKGRLRVLSSTPRTSLHLSSLLELERFTACFPLTYSTSPLDSCGISRIFGILCKDTLTDREVTECQQAIYRVQGIEVKKEPVSFKSKSGKRDGAIQELWQELEKLILSMANISSQHGKVRDCLYKIRGVHSVSEESLYVSSTSEGEITSKEGSSSNPLKRGVDQISDLGSSPTSVPVIKLAKTTSLHPSIAGEKVSLLSVLPKLVSKEFAGKLSGVTGPDGLYSEFQQKKHAMMGGIKKSSPYNSPHQSPKHRASQSPKHRTLLNRENPHR